MEHTNARMYIKISFTFVLTLWITSGTCDQNFTSHKVLGVSANDEEQLQFLRSLTRSQVVDVWSETLHLHETVDVQVPPEVANDLEDEFRKRGIDFYVVTDNLQEWIDKEREENPPNYEQTRSKRFRLDVYHTFETISEYIDSVAAKYPSLASVRMYGTTYEGNPIKGLKIGADNKNKSAIWIDAGIHAREWISPATALFIIDLLVTRYVSDPKIQKLVDRFDWYILPVANPDGYKYTWTTNRLWRKNRTKDPKHQHCTGTDLNRNFDIDFGGEGASRDPCTNTYQGPHAFSEAESRAIRDGINSIKNLEAFFSLHSYSQLWLTPYGYTKKHPRDYDHQIRMLKVAIDAVQREHGQQYRYGPAANILYLASGSSADWAYDKAKIKLAFSIELRDRGRQGFILSKKQIIPNAEENWAGIRSVAELLESKQWLHEHPGE